MTVEELVGELQKFNPKSIVRVEDTDEDLMRILSVFLEPLEKRMVVLSLIDEDDHQN